MVLLTIFGTHDFEYCKSMNAMSFREESCMLRQHDVDRERMMFEIKGKGVRKHIFNSELLSFFNQSIFATPIETVLFFFPELILTECGSSAKIVAYKHELHGFKILHLSKIESGKKSILGVVKMKTVVSPSQGVMTECEIQLCCDENVLNSMCAVENDFVVVNKTCVLYMNRSE
jgi:hypothetical protein